MRHALCAVAALLAAGCGDATVKMDPFLAQAPNALDLGRAVYGVQLIEADGVITMDGLHLIMWGGRADGDPCDLPATEGVQLNVYTPKLMGAAPMDAPAFVSGPVDTIGLDLESTPAMVDGQVRIDTVFPGALELECAISCVVTNAPNLLGAAMVADADGPRASGNFEAVHCPNLDAHGILEAARVDAR